MEWLFSEDSSGFPVCSHITRGHSEQTVHNEFELKTTHSEKQTSNTLLFQGIAASEIYFINRLYRIR